MSTIFEGTVTPPDSDAARLLCASRILFDNGFVLVAIFAPDGTLLEANPAACAAAGVLPGDVVGRTFGEIDALAHSREVVAQARALLERACAGEVVRAELPVRLCGGRIATVDCLVSPLRDATGRIAQIVATAVEITDQKRLQISLLKANRELRMLSLCTQALLRADSEASLLANVCRTIVETGGYRLAWVGIPEDDAERLVQPVAHAGAGAEYLAGIRVEWGESETSRGPSGRALRERTIQVCRDTDADPSFVPWRARARRYGFRSTLALPLTSGSECLGVLNIYAAEADRFDAAEIERLEQMAGDLAFGIGALRARESLRRFRALLDHTNDLIYVIDAESGRIVDANDAVSRRLGYTRDELLRMSVTDFSITAGQRPWPERIGLARRVGSLVTEGHHRAKGGEIVPVEVSLRYVERDRRPFVITVSRDITDRKHQEERIARLTRILRMQSAINAAVLRIRDRHELLREACRLASDVGGYERAVLSVVDADGRSAVPQFRAGAGLDFPEPAALPIGDGTEPDTNLSARALRTGEIAVCNDLRNSEPPVALREQLLALGYHSVVALPLIVDGRRVGVLTLTSRDASLVQDEELLLLKDMLASLSFALRSQQQADAAQFLADFDPLTGLAKRALFCERLDALLRSSAGPEASPAVVVCDVRNLNALNDTFGRRFGDRVLQRVAASLKEQIGSDDPIGYLGAGTFAFVTTQLASEEVDSSALLESDVFGRPFDIEGHTIRLSYSSGTARYPHDGRDADTLVQRAEATLKHAKESGEQYLHFQLERHSEIAERLRLEHRLRTAVDERQFELYYQPQCSLETGRIEAVEALLRWNDPESGIVPPGRFLPVLEYSGLIVPVGEWVLERALEDLARWSRLELSPVRLAVNVSALQLKRKAFVPKLLERHRRLGAAPGFGLDLEITETALLHDLEGTSRKLRELRTGGIRIALDDFGTGFSSLGLLSKLPVDTLKIDRTFVSGIPADSASMLLVESIVRLASAFRLSTVAEGVERPAQLDALRALGCRISQGFLHGAPVPRAKLEERLARASAQTSASPGASPGVSPSASPGVSPGASPSVSPGASSSATPSTGRSTGR